jgi:hypothetical protein
MGGKEIPTLTSTLAIVGAGNTNTNAKSIVPKNIFFILCPPIARQFQKELSCLILFTSRLYN